MTILKSAGFQIFRSMSRRIWISDISLYSYGSMDSDVIDFCGGLPQGVYDVFDMFAVKLRETPTDSIYG